MKYVLFLFGALFLFSCSEEIEYNLSNAYGNFQRNNHYPDISLLSQNYKEILIDEDAAGAVMTALPLDYQTIVIPSGNGTIHKIINETLQWTAKLENESRIASAMCADNLGNIYVAGFDANLYSFDKDGNLRWKYLLTDSIDASDIVSDLLALPDGVVAGISNGLIQKLDFKGNLIWKYQVKDYITKSFAGFANGDVLVPVTKNIFGKNDSLLIIDKNGIVKQNKEFEALRITSTPIISKSSIYLAGLKETTSGRVSEIICLDSNFNESWTKKVAVVIKSMSADDEGNLYIVGYNSIYGQNMSGIFKFDGEGKVLWQIYLETSIKSPVIISKNLLSVAGTSPKENAMFFLRKEDGVVSRSIKFDDKIKGLIYNPAILKNGSMIFPVAGELSFLKTIINEESLN
jgi:hypothetical protein